MKSLYFDNKTGPFFYLLFFFSKVGSYKGITSTVRSSELILKVL